MNTNLKIFYEIKVNFLPYINKDFINSCEMIDYKKHILLCNSYYQAVKLLSKIWLIFIIKLINGN